MSIMGTGAAASVAQTGLIAQQQGRAADKAVGDRKRAADVSAAAFEKRLKGPAETDDTPSELPDRGALGYENLYGPDGQVHGPGFDDATPDGDADGPPPPRAKLDVTG